MAKVDAYKVYNSLNMDSLNREDNIGNVIHNRTEDTIDSFSSEPNICDAINCDEDLCDKICDVICEVVCDKVCDEWCDGVCDKICDEVCDEYTP